MNSRTLTLPVLLLALMASAWGQNAPAAPEARTGRPLNLSLPKDVMRSSASPFAGEATDDTATRNLRPEAGRLPYGSGYEARQREMNAAGNVSRGSASSGGNGSGNTAPSAAGPRSAGGGGGRGGGGRGR